MKVFSINYAYEGKDYVAYIEAKDMADAEARLTAMAATGEIAEVVDREGWGFDEIVADQMNRSDVK